MPQGSTESERSELIQFMLYADSEPMPRRRQSLIVVIADLELIRNTEIPRAPDPTQTHTRFVPVAPDSGELIHAVDMVEPVVRTDYMEIGRASCRERV